MCCGTNKDPGISFIYHSVCLLQLFFCCCLFFSWRNVPETFTKINYSRVLFYLQGTCSAVRTTCSSYTDNMMQLIPTCHILSALGIQQTENFFFLFLFSFFLDECRGKIAIRIFSYGVFNLMTDGQRLL